MNDLVANKYSELLFLWHKSVYVLTAYENFLGPNCDEQLFSRNIQEREEGGYGHIVAVVFAGIVVIGVILAAWMYHRRRVADLKNEIAQVQYTAEPVSPPGKYCTSRLTDTLLLRKIIIHREFIRSKIYY